MRISKAILWKTILCIAFLNEGVVGWGGQTTGVWEHEVPATPADN